MKNLLTNKANAFRTLALSAFALAAIGLASCQDLQNPTGTDTKSTNQSMVINNTGDFGIDNNGYGDLAEKDGRPTNTPPKRIPLGCLNLTQDQMTQLQALNKKYEALRKAAREDFNTTMRGIKANSSTFTPDTTNRSANEAKMRELRTQDSLINSQMKAAQDELNQKLKAIEIKYAELMKNSATGGDAARKELQAKKDAEVREAKTAFENRTKNLKAQSDAIHKQMEDLKKSSGNGDDKGKRNISDETRAQIQAAEAALKAALTKIDADFDAEFRALLTAEQIAILDNWLATGKGCEVKKRK